MSDCKPYTIVAGSGSISSRSAMTAESPEFQADALTYIIKSSGTHSTVTKAYLKSTNAATVTLFSYCPLLVSYQIVLKNMAG